MAAHFLCFTTLVNFATASLLKLDVNFPFLNHPDHYVIHAEPESFKAVQARLKSTQIFRLQLVTFRNSSLTDGPVLYENTSKSIKFNRHINILIQPFWKYSKPISPLQSILCLANHPVTLVLILRRQYNPVSVQPRWSSILPIRHLPALKIIVQISSDTNQIRTAYLYCNLNCKTKTTLTAGLTTSINLQQILNQPLIYHRYLYRVGNDGKFPP